MVTTLAKCWGHFDESGALPMSSHIAVLRLHVMSKKQSSTSLTSSFPSTFFLDSAHVLPRERIQQFHAALSLEILCTKDSLTYCLYSEGETYVNGRSYCHTILQKDMCGHFTLLRSILGNGAPPVVRPSKPFS